MPEVPLQPGDGSPPARLIRIVPQPRCGVNPQAHRIEESPGCFTTPRLL
ncbi:MAG: hypothetical protein U0840_27645 [Gemmataceae bacterium]